MLMEADLPEDIEALRAFALEQSRKLAEVMAAKGEAEAEIERLQSIVDAFMRHRFGPRSEQLDPDQLQLGLEDVETALGQARAAQDAAAGPAQAKSPRKTNRGSLPPISNGSSRWSISRTRHAPAVAVHSTRSARTWPNVSMSCPPPSASSSLAARATAAVRARRASCRLQHQRGSSRAAFRLKR
jgi:hypothetical protein